MKLGTPRKSALHCPYEECRTIPFDPVSGRIVRNGAYRRKHDSKAIPRFRCLSCRRTFSSSRFSPCFGQKKRRVNPWVRDLLVSGVSLRRTARVLGLNPKTVTRKLLFLSSQAKLSRLEYLERLQKTGTRLTAFQFDEMESSVHSKCLPVSIPMVVLPGSRKILSFRVGKMPAKGLIAQISKKKYGPRADERTRMAHSIFSELSPLFEKKVEISSDENPRYPDWIKKYFPEAKHIAHLGKRGCVVGQGELKKLGFDPLFDFNHTAAMLRANINRLFRRTWCTTKKIENLEAHIELYAQYHNEVLTQAP